MRRTAEKLPEPAGKTASRRKKNAEASAAAVKPIITKLYDGTADLLIRIPQMAKKNRENDIQSAGTNTCSLHPEQKEIIELTLSPAGKGADDNDRVASLTSSLIASLLKDIDSAKQARRKALQAAGIARAHTEGKQFGRRCRDLDADLFEELCRAYKNNEISSRDAGKRLGCSPRTFLRRYYLKYPDEKKVTGTKT